MERAVVAGAWEAVKARSYGDVSAATLNPNGSTMVNPGGSRDNLRESRTFCGAGATSNWREC